MGQANTVGPTSIGRSLFSNFHERAANPSHILRLRPLRRINVMHYLDIFVFYTEKWPCVISTPTRCKLSTRSVSEGLKWPFVYQKHFVYCCLDKHGKFDVESDMAMGWVNPWFGLCWVGLSRRFS